MTAWLQGLQQLVKFVALGWAQALTHPFLIILRYACNLLLSWLMLKPFLNMVGKLLPKTELGEQTSLPITLLNDFSLNYPGFQGFDANSPFLLLLMFGLLQIYFSGGIFHCLWQRGGPQAFFDASRRHFFPLLGIMFLSMILGIVSLSLPIAIWAYALNWLDRGLTFGHGQLYWLWWGGLLAIFLMMGSAVLRVNEYARLMLTRPGGKPLSFFRHFWNALVFTYRHHVGTFFLILGFAAFHPLLIWSFGFLKSPDAPQSLLLFIGQGLILARIAASLAAHKGQMLYLVDLWKVPAEVSPQAKEDEEAAHPWERHDVLDEFPGDSEESVAVDPPADDAAAPSIWEREPADAEAEPLAEAPEKERIVWEPDPQLMQAESRAAAESSDALNQENYPAPEPIDWSAGNSDGEKPDKGNA